MKLFVVVGSRFHPAKIRVVKPTIIDIKSTNDDIRNNKAHGFVRSIR